MSRKKRKAPTSRSTDKRKQSKQASSKWIWISLFGIILILIVGAVYLIAQNQSPINSLPPEISIDQAYDKYQSGGFLLDVRTPEEWEEYHIPGTTLIPLDELSSRVSELPQNEEIVVVCRSGNRSQVGRDTLLSAGFDQVTSMSGGLSQWRSAGYPVE